MLNLLLVLLTSAAQQSAACVVIGNTGYSVPAFGIAVRVVCNREFTRRQLSAPYLQR
jgi:hypothetical protein